MSEKRRILATEKKRKKTVLMANSIVKECVKGMVEGLRKKGKRRVQLIIKLIWDYTVANSLGYFMIGLLLK